MAALMELQNIFVFTHDSIGLGEDGPTHQPVEHTASLRIMPNMSVWSPCDTVETAVAWRYALERRDGPTSLILTRQGLPHQARSAAQVASIGRGGYVLRDTIRSPDLIIDRDRFRGCPCSGGGSGTGWRRSEGSRRLDAVHGSV